MNHEGPPRWDLTSIYPGLDSAAFTADSEEHARLLAELEEAIMAAAAGGGSPEPDRLLELIDTWNRTSELGRRLRSFLSCLTMTSVSDSAAQAASSRLRMRMARLRPLEAAFGVWVSRLDLDSAVAAAPALLPYRHLLRQAALRAPRQMDLPLEDLAADLNTCGLLAWTRLYDDLTALITVPFETGGEKKELPMSEIRGLANHPDREVRRAAYAAELDAWRRHEVPLAAAMNGVKGAQAILNDRRGWSGDLEPALLENSIDAGTLDAMHAACRESFPLFHRYLRARARLLGIPRMGFFDLFAPGSPSPRRWSWREAEEFILKQFGAYSARMQDLARRAFEQRWVDAEPREGKVGGAYCTRVHGDVSRILMNWNGSSSSLSTLAHELGHAYHNVNLGPRPALVARTPSTLAETSSIFCETLCIEAALEEADPAEELALLDLSLQRDLQIVVDIHSRFLFEQRVLQRRREAELSAGELCALMEQAQAETFGDGLDPELRHPYMWAAKPHYYGALFYNFPYTFGLLFGLGLYQQYRREPDQFRAGYDDLLSRTGMATAAELGRDFGIDTRSAGFWRDCFSVIASTVDRFESRVKEQTS